MQHPRLASQLWPFLSFDFIAYRSATSPEVYDHQVISLHQKRLVQKKIVKKLMPFPPAHYYSGRRQSEGGNEFDREAKNTSRWPKCKAGVEVELTPKKIPWGTKRSTNIRQLPSSGPRARESKVVGVGVRMGDEKKHSEEKIHLFLPIFFVYSCCLL
jgi:hypothetical protein